MAQQFDLPKSETDLRNTLDKLPIDHSEAIVRRKVVRFRDKLVASHAKTNV